MMISAGIMIRLAFSMPPLMPRDTTKNTIAMKMKSQIYDSKLLVMKLEKYVPPSPIMVAGSKK